MRDNQRGQAVVMVLLLTTVIFVIGSAALALSLSVTRSAAREVNQKQAYYIAEAGVRRGLEELMFRVNSQEPESADSFIYIENPGQAYLTGGQEGKLDSVSVERVSETDVFIIKSKAHYPDPPGPLTAYRGIEARVQVAVDPFIWSDSIGSGIKASGDVDINGVISSTSGAIVARTGDIDFSDFLFSGISGGIYAGHDVNLDGGVATSGRGDIHALNNVRVEGNLFGLFSPTWNGRVWYGGWTNLPSGPQVTKTSEVPGFPLPEFPYISKTGPWYQRVKRLAEGQGHCYNGAEGFYDDPGVLNLQFTPHYFELFGKYVFVSVDQASLDLNGIYVIKNGPLDISAQAYHAAYLKRKEQISANLQWEYGANTHVIFPDDFIPDFLKGLGLNLLMPTLKVYTPSDRGATLVADSINVDGGILAGFAGVDLGTVNKSLGLFGVAGDVRYHAQFGSGGSMAVLTGGDFYCQAIAGTPIFDWVVAKENVVINSAFEFNQSFDEFPPGTPCGYKILSWREISWQED